MAATYGASGNRVYWIVNLVNHQFGVNTGPTSDGYGPARVYQPGEDVPVVLESTEVGRLAVSKFRP
jgi:hypothetical protein